MTTGVVAEWTLVAEKWSALRSDLRRLLTPQTADQNPPRLQLLTDSPHRTLSTLFLNFIFLKKCFFYYSYKQRSAKICNSRIIFTTMWNLWSRLVIFWLVGAGLIFCHRDPSDGLSSWPRNQGGTKMKHGSGQKSRPHGEKKNRNAANSNHNQPHHHLCKSDHIRRENPLLSLCSSACCAISRYPLILIFFPPSTIFSATIVNYMDWVG